MLAVVLAVLLAADVAHAEKLVEPASWRLVDVVEGVQVFAAEPGEEFWGLARGRVEASPETIFRRVSNFEALPHVYPWLDAVRVLERGDASALVYFRYDLPWPLSDREYTAAHHWRTEPSGTIALIAESSGLLAPHDHDVVPVEGLLVRMTFTPIRNGAATEVDYLFRGDLGGMLPRSVRAQTAWKIPMNTILSMRRSCEPPSARHAIP
jgi:hypothetical protein